MKAYDFEYDGYRLSSFGYIICKFGSDGLETVSNGSQITFNTISTLHGLKQELTSVEYGECLESTFQICKNPCNGDIEMTVDDIRELSRWLNRKEFLKFKLLDNEYLNLYFEASFNISKIESNGKTVGLELNMITNRPFALQEPRSIVLESIIENDVKIINDTSDEEGYIYPHMKITVNQDGDLSIHNKIEDRIMEIKNCSVGEVITLDYPIIQSTFSSHKIQNDFNWNFFRIANTFRNKKNELTISIPCIIELSYSPIVKMSI